MVDEFDSVVDVALQGMKCGDLKSGTYGMGECKIVSKSSFYLSFPERFYREFISYLLPPMRGRIKVGGYLEFISESNLTAGSVQISASNASVSLLIKKRDTRQP